MRGGTAASAGPEGEDHMGGSMDSAISRTLMCDATACLIGIATSIDCLYESNQSLELLEAKRAIHNALIAVAEWKGSLDEVHLAPIAN
jgi:hypothetical protein